MTEQVQTTNQGNKTLWVAVIGAIVVVGIGVVAFLMLGNGANLISGTLLGSGTLPEDQFVVKMNEFVLRPGAMESAYQVDPGSDRRMSNAQLATEWGPAFAKAYIGATGRVDGWNLAMQRVNTYDFTPEYIQSRVEIYADAEGASTALSEEWFWAYQIEGLRPDQFLDKNCNVGGDCVSYMYSNAKAGSGAVNERYDVALRYKNAVIWVYAKGQQGEVSENMVLEYAQMVLDNVKTVEN